MQKLKIPFLVISFLPLFLVSCASKAMKEYTALPVTQTNFSIPYFADAGVDYVYKAHITVFGKEFGGIFITKKINDTTHRVVFTTEFGNTLFDFEISGDRMKVNAIVEELDRGIIKKTLQHDFALLLKKDFAIEGQYENDTITVYQSRDKKRFNFIFVSKKENKVLKMNHSSRLKEKITVEYLSENNTLATKIDITHKNFPLRIELDFIND